jgi:hypothetical protein
VKDLLYLYRATSASWLENVIVAGVEFVRELDFEQALRRSPYYIEWIDVLDLYNQLLEPVSMDERRRVAEAILRVTGGASLDHSAVVFSEEKG